jgi:hypothetical protein
MRYQPTSASEAAWRGFILLCLEARIVAGHAPRPNRCFGYRIVPAVRRPVVLEKFTHAIVRSVVSRDARPIGQRSFRLNGNRRRHYQIPTHKRERGCVAECHCRGANGLSGIGDLPSAAEVAQATLTSAVLLRHEGELLLLPHPAIQIASTNSISAAA